MPTKDSFDHVVDSPADIRNGRKVAVIGDCLHRSGAVWAEDRNGMIGWFYRAAVKPLPQPVKVYMTPEAAENLMARKTVSATAWADRDGLAACIELTITPEQIEAARKAVAK